MRERGESKCKATLNLFLDDNIVIADASVLSLGSVRLRVVGLVCLQC